jgi:hypothetical protein
MAAADGQALAAANLRRPFLAVGRAAGIGLDWTPRELRHVLVCGELMMADVRQQVALSLLTEFENFTVFEPGDYNLAALNTLLDQVVAWERRTHPAPRGSHLKARMPPSTELAALRSSGRPAATILVTTRREATMTDYGHDLTFGTFITPQNQRPQDGAALAQLTERAGLDLVTVMDYPYGRRSSTAVAAAGGNEVDRTAPVIASS